MLKDISPSIIPSAVQGLFMRSFAKLKIKKEDMVQTRATNLQNMSTSEEQIAALTQVVETLRQQITNLNQQVTDQATELQAARQANQQVAFALNPTRASTNVIGMMSKDGMKSYKLGLEKVYSLCFDRKPKSVNFFRATVHKKALDCGWYDTGGKIFNILNTSVTPKACYYPPNYQENNRLNTPKESIQLKCIFRLSKLKKMVIASPIIEYVLS